MSGFLAGLNSFAGGLASGINTATQIANRREEMRQRKEEHEANMKDRAVKDAIQADLAAIGQDAGPRFTGSQFEDPGFADEAQARAAAAPPAPKQAIPTDPLAPLPEAAPQAPAKVTVRDHITGMYHNVDPSQVREFNDTDRAKEAFKVYMKHGRAEEGYKFLNQFFQTRANQMSVEREEMADSFTRNMMNPQRMAEEATKLLGGFGTDFEVTVNNVPMGDGKSAPLLMLNMKGSNAPPIPIGAELGGAAPTYQQQVGLLIDAAKGDLAGGLARLVSTQATIENIATARQNRQQSAEAFPLEQQQRRAGIANTQATTEATRTNTRRTEQAITLDANQDTRENDELYGTGGPVFGGKWQETDHPGSPRDAGARKHKGWDYSGLRVGTPIKMEKNGEVVERKNNNGNAGNMVTVRYDDGTEHTFMHLQGFHKQFPVGKKFKAGQTIAYAGNTGNASTRGTDKAVLHVEGSAGQPGRVGIPSRAQREKDKVKDERLAKVTEEAIKAVTEEGRYEPGTGEFNAAVRTRVTSLGQLYGIGPAPGTGKEIPFKRK